MNEPTDSFDWSSLGDEPLPGERDDAALLDAVLMEASGASKSEDAPGSSSPWVRPVAAAIVLFAAAVALFLLAPRWSEALRGSDDDGSLTPDVETPEPEDTAVRKHAEASRKPGPPRVEPKPSVAPPTIEAGPAPESPGAPSGPDSNDTVAKAKPKAAAVPPPAADDLLRRAQDALAAKDTRGAIRAYSRLLEAHPRSPQARAGRLSLGRLELSAGHAKKALSHYDAYLRGKGGTMRREAELGRIDALHALGRTSAERSAIEAFLDTHPNTVHATRLRARLDALR